MSSESVLCRVPLLVGGVKDHPALPLFPIALPCATMQKNTDVFASAFGFFFIGCDFISSYVISDYKVPRSFFGVQEPLLWFFKVQGSQGPVQ